MHALTAGILLACIPWATSTSAQEWTRFRGSNGSGTATATGLPTVFNGDTNLSWRTPTPRGQSSPVLGSSALFLTGYDESGLIVLALGRASGEVRWSRTLERTRDQDVYPANDSASPTPTTDGENVYVFFPELGLLSFDAAGEERWRLPLGPFVSFYGMSASPILAGKTLVLVCDQQQGSYLLGVDATSGEVLWKTMREGIVESWSTPVLYPTAQEPESILVFGSRSLCSYSVETGAEEWRQSRLGYTPVCSPVLAEGLLLMSVPFTADSGLPAFAGLVGRMDANEDGMLSQEEMGDSPLAEHHGWADSDKDDLIDSEEWKFVRQAVASRDAGLVVFEAGADGEAPTELWRYQKRLPEIATPLLLDGVIYLVKHGGILTTLDAATGDVIEVSRMPDALGDYNASPIAADGKVFLANSEGQIHVIAAGREFEVLSVNDLGEAIHATPAIGGESLFFRTESSVFCFTKDEG